MLCFVGRRVSRPTFRASSSNAAAAVMSSSADEQPCFVSRLLAAAVCVSERAALVVKDIVRAGDLKIEEKGWNDIQTEADRAAQYCIIQSLQRQFGNKLCIIGEEEKESEVQAFETGQSEDVLALDKQCSAEMRKIKEEDVVIWVDPIDGTKEFADGCRDKSELLEQVTMLIGVSCGGRPVGGVVHQPFCGFATSRDFDAPGRTIWALRGVGAHGTRADADSGSKTVVTTRSHPTQMVQDALDALKAAGLSDAVERVGGAGYKVLRAVEGQRAYVFASKGCKKWDTCAPEAILLEAGLSPPATSPGEVARGFGWPPDGHSRQSARVRRGRAATEQRRRAGDPARRRPRRLRRRHATDRRRLAAARRTPKVAAHRCSMIRRILVHTRSSVACSRMITVG